MQEHMLKTLATEALKPVSSIVDALLGPKIENIRKSAKKRELLSKLEDKTVNNLLEHYFRRLLRRVSEIKTLAFPEQVLPLTTIYEPLQLANAISTPNRDTASSDETTENPAVKFTAQSIELGVNYLIVDTAGMGKSTFSKHLILDIFHNTVKIPLFLELRRIDETESLIHKLATEIDEHIEYINEDLLEMLLAQGGYVIVLDGYDELSESARKYIGTQITELAVKYEQNSIILTSRPEVNLPELSHSICFNIQRLTKEQSKSLILRYDTVANLTVGQELIKELDVVSPEFLETPLLVVLLYQTFGYNHSIATKITTFYDDVFNALYKGHDLSKASFARPKASRLDSVDFRRLLRGFAFLLTAQQKNILRNRVEAYEIIEKAATLTSINPFSASAFLDDLLLAVPLMIKDGNEFRFIHKSIGDFFSGEYLAFAPNAEELISGIQDSTLDTAFTKSIDFLADLNPSLFRTSIVAPIAKAFLEMKPTTNPLLSTIRFAGNFEIILFTKLPEDIISLLSNINSGSLTIERLNKTTYLVIRGADVVRIPVEAWRLLTLPVKLNFKSAMHLNEKKLLSLFTINKWHPINNQFYKNKTNAPEIKAILFRIIRSISRQDREGRMPEFRILNRDLCKKLLAAIKVEKKSHDWLNKLIKNG